MMKSLVRPGCYAAFGISAVVMMLTGGCVVLNESGELHGTDPLPAFQANVEPMDFQGEPTIENHDRRHWESVKVHVSVNDTQTIGSNFGRWKTLNDNPVHRNTGRYPTEESVLELANRPEDVRAQYSEALLEPWRKLLHIVLIPAFMVRDRPFRNVKQGPWEHYQRSYRGQVQAVQLYPVDTDETAPETELLDVDDSN